MSNSSKYNSSLIKVNKNILKELLEEKIIDFTGKITNINDVKEFNLSAHLNYRFYDKRVMYLGDSAHSIHPIAGQGWNIGVRDIENCLKVLIESEALGQDFGNEFNCKKFDNLCFYDAFALYQITDKLNSVFINDKFVIKKLRSLVLL